MGKCLDMGQGILCRLGLAKDISQHIYIDIAQYTILFPEVGISSCRTAAVEEEKGQCEGQDILGPSLA